MLLVTRGPLSFIPRSSSEDGLFVSLQVLSIPFILHALDFCFAERASLSIRQKKESARCGERILVPVERTSVVSVERTSVVSVERTRLLLQQRSCQETYMYKHKFAILWMCSRAVFLLRQSLLRVSSEKGISARAEFPLRNIYI
ncbi:hypothetical protein Taro_024623 [Colocasia esculenta]|uniref:Uncharacterized protein n=1 Tax=Colocasia esculenta TaxID=4460 RepID=A0A843V6S4_COLES|nr:hypothetical protein [Colocasia esculenta]